jgi:hypothetical protein
MAEHEWKVPVGDQSVSVRADMAPTAARGLFVCAHGAGGQMNDRGMAQAAEAMRSAGLDVVRFNFPYTESKSRRPDPMPRLMDTIRAVVAHARSKLKPTTLIIGGRSMGGRAASMLAAEGFDCDGLLLLAYPLHPAGLKTRLRDEHLPRIRVPVLCFNGTRDALCDRELMDRTLERVTTPWTMHWLDGADHSFHVLKSSGRTDADVFAEVTAATRSWLDLLVR